MHLFNPSSGLGTLVNHISEGGDSLHSQVMPIYQTSTFGFEDAEVAAATFRGEHPGYIYTRFGNPNHRQLVLSYAALEGLDLLRAHAGTALNEIVDGQVFASGMSAITTAILARVKSGDTIIAQEALYGATYTFLNEVMPRYGIKTAFIQDLTADKLDAAFTRNPGAALVFLETPTNPTLAVVDLAEAAEVAHRHQAWLMVDNTFATPYCQRPLSLGADVVIHSTTKYLGGHGNLTGGAVISPHLEYIRKDLLAMMKILGGTPSPFDAWQAMIGLKTFELRMARHVENAMAAARFLEGRAKVSRVYYPGLESDPGHAIAKKQMSSFGGMLSFELKGGLPAGVSMMNHVQLASLAPTLGNTETLIMHPASMSHVTVPPAVRQSMGISDGLVRLSVGIENIEDILADLEQAMA